MSRWTHPRPASLCFCNVLCSCADMYTRYSSQHRECFGCVEFLSCFQAREALAYPVSPFLFLVKGGTFSRRWQPKVTAEPGVWPGRNLRACPAPGQCWLNSTTQHPSLPLAPLSVTTLPSGPSSVGISRGGCSVHSTNSFLGPASESEG